MKVLLIDDDALTGAYLTELVAGRAELSIATSLAAVDDPGAFDALICDRRLPDGDGWLWLAARPSLPPIVLRISGDAASGAWRKPIAPDLLLAALGLLPGDVDDAQAMRSLGANPDAIAKLRAMLLQDLASARVCTAAKLASEDIDAIHRFAAGSRLVGFPGLAASATALERAWRSEQPVDELLKQFQRAVRRVLELP